MEIFPAQCWEQSSLSGTSHYQAGGLPWHIRDIYSCGIQPTTEVSSLYFYVDILHTQSTLKFRIQNTIFDHLAESMGQFP